MGGGRARLERVVGAVRPGRRRLALRHEFLLALLPTLSALAMLAVTEALSRQRLLFASLASSAFLIYRDPHHGMNSVRTLALAQLTAAGVGALTYSGLGPGYLAGGAAMLATIVAMIALDAVHPPAIGTSLIFAFRTGDAGNLALFALAVGVTAVLVGLERAAVWLLARFADHQDVDDG